MRTDDFYVDRTRTVEYPGLSPRSREPARRHGRGGARSEWTARSRMAVCGRLRVAPHGLGERVRLRPRPRAERRHLAPVGSNAFPARRMAGRGICGRETGRLHSLATGSPLFDHSFRLRGEVLRRYDAMPSRLRMIAGATAAYDQIDTANPAGRQTIFDARHTGHQAGAFGQADYDVGSRAKVMGALRVDDASTYSVGLAEGCRGPDRGQRSDRARRLRPRVPACDIRRAVPRCAGAADRAGRARSGAGSGRRRSDLQFDAAGAGAGKYRVEAGANRQFRARLFGSVRRQWLFTVDAYRSRMRNFISGFLPQVGTSLGRINPRYGPYRPPPR